MYKLFPGRFFSASGWGLSSGIIFSACVVGQWGVAGWQRAIGPQHTRSLAHQVAPNHATRTPSTHSSGVRGGARDGAHTRAGIKKASEGHPLGIHQRMACKEPTRRCHFAATQRSPQMSTHSPACRADSTIQVLFVLMHWKKGTLVLVCEGEERVARYDTLAKTHTRHELTLIEADASVKRTLAFERNVVDHVVSSFCFHTTKSGCTVCAPAHGGQCCQTHLLWMPWGKDRRSLCALEAD